jgi:Xaa-Pro aminopeptidase
VIPPADILKRRQHRVAEILQSLDVARLLVTALPNVSWLTGFDGSAAAAVVHATPGTAVQLVTDNRYADSAALLVRLGAGAVERVLVEQTYDETIATLLLADGLPVGCEAASLTLARFRWFEARLASESVRPTLTATVDVVESCRIVKDAWEIDVLREAGRRLSAVAMGVLADLRPGIAERDVAQAIEAGLRRAGFSRPAFDTIVASGPRAALPHGRASDRRLAAGELVVLDFGGVYGGYCVDLTRTVALGDPGPDARGWHAAVLAAQAAAIAAVTPGRAIADIDRSARDVLVARGLGELFRHGTGHGLGLEVHEAPRVGPRRAETAHPLPAGTVQLPEHLAAGMVFTVEPGVYVPDRGGVRIEDDVLVTASGVEVLTSVPRTLDVA